MTTQGSREILIGIEVDQITTDSPIVDITEATAEIKASQPDNEKLQSLCVPKAVGGQVDILLCIQYLSHFPKLVHSLESGLGIYEVRLPASSPQHLCTWLKFQDWMMSQIVTTQLPTHSSSMMRSMRSSAQT